ncbi:MAG: hypothetical protein AAGJ83_01565, partial [Planctomycetota bacterium]
MIQQLILDLAGKRHDTTQPVGTPIVIEPGQWRDRADENSRSMSNDAGDRNGDDRSSSNSKVVFTLRAPDGERELPVPPSGEQLRVTSTYRPGVYEVRRRTTDLQGRFPDRIAIEMRVADVDPSESLMQGMTDEKVQTMADVLEAEVFRSAEEIRSTDRLRTFGYELWRPLLVVLLIALVLELWLQQNLVSRRSTVSSPLSAGVSS